MDPLEDVMTTMRVASSLYICMQLRAPYGVRFDTRAEARLVVITRGSCWLTADDLPQPVSLAAGDCLIVKAETQFALQDELGRRLVSCDKVLSKITGLTVQHGGDGVLTEMLSGALSFDAAAAEPLMAVMPRLVHVRLDEARAHLLQTTLQLIGLETAEDGLGARLVIGRLHDVLFVQAVRAWCATDQQAGGWLAGLKDDRLAVSIRAMHGDLARGWTVETLAREAGLSRSTFAATFKAVTGDTPLDYLTRWRMYRAKVLLRGSELSLIEIAERVGYETDAALSRAFRRFEGVAPGKWRRNGRPGPSGTERRALPRRRTAAPSSATAT
ncbi:MAG TPA: AraC family transcriptional regulator [Steroidobacteraceae bacterium]|jgi:AraC-like DNA-binding protein|nr:AraC family transcriptional regulator [Steroidobacteraceae bacterium]